MINRRDAVGILGALSVGACARPCPIISLPSAGKGNPIVDAHCHLFNVKDLSAVRFISRVFLEQYPELARSGFAPEDPSILDRLVMVFLALAGAGFAPSATNELALLQKRPVVHPGEDRSAVPPQVRQEETVRTVAGFLGGRPLGIDQEIEEDARRMIVHAGTNGRSEIAPSGNAERLAIARLAVMGGGERTLIGKSAGSLSLEGFFHFAMQLRRFRHCLVEELTNLHRNAGQEPILLAPAMVDFGRWLRDDPQRGSTFADQIRLWSHIARRHSGPAVHGYVGYCPLRQVQFERGLLGPGKRIKTPCHENPLELVRAALAEHGFLGVKLYPPMGFRAARNRERGTDFPYPREVLNDVFATDRPSSSQIEELGRALDDALERLYALCADMRAPIMAHAANSNAAFEGSGLHADPYYWRPVFDRAGAPPVMLAHFGGFEYESVDPEDVQLTGKVGAGLPVPFERTWEASLARYVSRYPSRLVFADISMFVELFDDSRRKFLIDRFQLLDKRYPAMKDHLIFGTDWHMLAMQPRAGEYDGLARAFVAEAFGHAAVEPIMRGNFLHFSGLAAGGAARARIEKFYAGDTVLLSRLALLETG